MTVAYLHLMLKTHTSASIAQSGLIMSETSKQKLAINFVKKLKKLNL